MELAEFGMIGLGTMGRNFLLNVAEKGYPCIGYDLDTEKVDALNKEGSGHKVLGARNLKEFTSNLKTPRNIMLLVPAGKIVDAVIDDLLPHLDKGNLLIDGGNSHFSDTERREKYLNERGFEFLGVGVSGGAEGARSGPSIMIGGNKETYKRIQPIFEAVSAQVDDKPCASHVGKGSAGHFVKMVHNGIEYGLMQLICESYDVMKRGFKMTHEEMSQIFAEWNEGELNSFLLEITSKILRTKDDKSDDYLVEKILDTAGQKGTGRWTSESALELGVPLPTIDAAVTMRQISAMKEDRSKLKTIGTDKLVKEKNRMLKETVEGKFNVGGIRNILYSAYVITYAQGFSLLRAASKERGYDLNMAEIAKTWCGGCIIRANLLKSFRRIFSKNPSIESLLLDEDMSQKVLNSQLDFAIFNLMTSLLNIPSLAFSTAFSYFEAIRSARLPANLLQAQRDFFGSHTYKRIDKEGTFHTEWEKARRSSSQSIN